MNGIDASYLGLPRAIGYYGEGEWKSFTPTAAVSGIGSHEAMNLRAFERTAGQKDELAADQQIEIKMSYDPAAKRTVVAGGESRATLLKRKAAPPNLTELEEKDAAAKAGGNGSLTGQVRGAAGGEGSPQAKTAVEKIRTSREKLRSELERVEQKLGDGSQGQEAGTIRRATKAESGDADDTQERRKLESQKTELKQKLTLLDKVLSKENMKENIKMQQKVMQALGGAEALNSLLMKVARGIPGEEQQQGGKASTPQAARRNADGANGPDIDINLALAQL